MRCAIFIARLDEQKVSQSNFNNMIINGFNEIDNFDKHELFLFTFSKGDSFKNNNLRLVSITDFIPNKLIRVTKRCISLIPRLLLTLPYLRRYAIRLNLKRFVEIDNYLDKALTHHNIRLVWFVTGHGAPARIPYIMTVWDCNHIMNPFLPEASYSGLGWDSLENGMSKATRKATYLIAGTEIGKQQVKNFYRVREDLIKVIPFPCYSLNKFDANYFNDKYSINRTELPKQYLFYPARFLPHKNHITLILALDILRKKYNTELNLVLVGRDNGNRRYVFDAIKRLGLEANVRHFGMVSSEDLVYLYKNAYALVYCSMNGPDNLPPLEAFTLGCPVIASKVIGATEQLGDAAILFETCDENDLATKIISLLNDETLRQSLIARGLKKAVGFSEKDYVSHVYDIFVEFSRIARAWERNDVRIEP